MPLGPRLIVIALLPVLAANLCFLISARAGHIPSCFAYLDGCTSISSTGRHGLGYVLFKLTMLPQAALLYWLWGAYKSPGGARLQKTVRIAGRLGAAFLVVYVLTLGADTPLYAVMRRYGVFVYFIGTFVAMAAASVALRRHQRSLAPGALCVAMLALGLAEIPLGKFGLADNQAENIIEWNFALLMQTWFLALLAAHRTDRPGAAPH